MEYFKEGVRFNILEENPYFEVYVLKDDVLKFAEINNLNGYDTDSSMGRSFLRIAMYITASKYALSNNFRKAHGHKKIKRSLFIKIAEKYANMCAVYSDKN